MVTTLHWRSVKSQSLAVWTESGMRTLTNWVRLSVRPAGCGESPPAGSQRPGGQGHLHDGPGERKVGSLRNNPSRQPDVQKQDHQGELGPQVERGLRGRTKTIFGMDPTETELAYFLASMFFCYYF